MKISGKQAVRRTVLVNRAVPGSGKSSFAQEIRKALEAAGISVRIHSTDEYFMVGDHYVFDLRKLGEYHNRNLEAFKASLAAGIGLVVLDNTDEQPWETRPYTDAARAAGYRIVFLDFLPRPLEAHLAAQQVSSENPGAHQIPETVLREHIARFLDCEELLRPGAVPDPARHADYRWDEETATLVRLDTPAAPFDFDEVVTVRPEEYHALKLRIGGMILKKMRA